MMPWVRMLSLCVYLEFRYAVIRLLPDCSSVAANATAFFVHATFLEKGFKLRSLGESGDDQGNAKAKI